MMSKIKLGIMSAVAVILSTGFVKAEDKPLLSIAAVADPQYADAPRRGGREPREALNRMHHAVSEFNKRDIDWGVILGDIIDWDDIEYGRFPHKIIAKEPISWKHKNTILNAWAKANFPGYIVLGNHDYYVPNEDKDGVLKPQSVYRAFGFKGKAYYDFESKGFRFVVLEGDLSYLNYSPKHARYKEAYDYYKKFKGPQKKWWNAAISKEQQGWLIDVLDKALSKKEPVVIMCHYPIHKSGQHSLLNDTEILKILDQYPNICIYLNGHAHGGDYKLMGKRHHLNLRGMQGDADAWYKIDFYSDTIKVFQAEKTSKPIYELKIDKSWQDKK